jgi:L-lactate permease
MSAFTLAIAAGVAMVLILAAIAFFRGNVPGLLAALYSLLLTVGCVVIFYRNTSHSPAASVALQATVARQEDIVRIAV